MSVAVLAIVGSGFGCGGDGGTRDLAPGPDDPSGRPSLSWRDVLVHPAWSGPSERLRYLLDGRGADGWRAHTWVVSTVAGNDGFYDGTGGPRGTAEFKLPWGVATDSVGNVYVTDFNRIRRIDVNGTVTTLAGNGVAGDVDGTGGPFGTAEFNQPAGLAVDSSGNVYVADIFNKRIRKIDPSRNVSTLAGNGVQGYSDGTGGRAGSAEFFSPVGVAIDRQGGVIVADAHCIRRINPAGDVTTLAGSPVKGFADGDGPSAMFNNIGGLALGPDRAIYVADTENYAIRRVDSSGHVTTWAGDGTAGFLDGPKRAAEFVFPVAIVFDSDGNAFVSESRGNRVRKVDTSGQVSTLAGNGVSGYADGSGGPTGASEFDMPGGIAAGASGNLYVADALNSRIRRIDPSGAVTTFAGNGGGSFGMQGWAQDGTGGPYGSAQLFLPQGVAVDLDGNVYVADTYDHRVRKIDPDGNVTTLAGNGKRGFVDGTGGAEGTAEFNFPKGVAVDETGVVYVADCGNFSIRKIDNAGDVTTLAGDGIPGWRDGPGGRRGIAGFTGPLGVAVDSAGYVYVADEFENRIRRIDPDGYVTTFAGDGAGAGVAPWTHPAGAYFADGPSAEAEFDEPRGVAVDGAGNVYVADSENNRIRKIDSDRIVTTVAGNGQSGWADGTGGPNGTAQFREPNAVSVDEHGVLYVADSLNARVRRISLSGDVDTIAGNGTSGWSDGSGGANGTASFFTPLGIAVDRSGRVYVGDWGNSRVRLISPAGR